MSDAVLIACAVLLAPVVQVVTTHVLVVGDLRRRRRNIERAIELAHHDLLRDMHHLATDIDGDEGRKPS